MQPNLVLLFVYGIERSSLSAVTDYHHSAGSAKTPRCNLYSLIITPVGMKKGWKRFLNDLTISSRFLFRDEFQQEFKIQDTLVPAVFIQTGKSIHQLITADEINRVSSTDQLADLVKQRFVKYFA
ncbi:MAG: hypothetical protein ABSE07_02895 [Methanoregula sp.]|jgi:hypothetical protein